MKIILSTRHKIIYTFLALLIAVHVGNVSFFIHEHQVGDVLIAHSHPYTSSSHSHTETAITAISWLSHFYSIDMEINEVGDLFLDLLCRIVEEKSKDPIIGFTESGSQRAPPCYINL